MNDFSRLRLYLGIGLGVLVSLVCQSVRGQVADSSKKVTADTIPVNELTEVVVKAFEISKKLISQPAPVYFLQEQALDRYSNSNILPAINTIPGVRMEERSPSSYRLNIRGSSLRSPFGVRDVKIYYNGIPVTDPTGDTYLNEFSFTDFGNIEIIKGSVGSAYGAGIGGTMLITSPLLADNIDTGVSAGVGATIGSYNRGGTDEFVDWGRASDRNRISYSDLKSDGYRDHTASDQQTFSFESDLKSGTKQELDFFAHYTDLYYQTPGALTLSQYNTDPKLARTSAGSIPSAAASHAAVFQKNFISGINQTYSFTNHFENTTSLYASYTDFINPTFLDYELRKEPHFGGRTVFTGHWGTPQYEVTLAGGMELQQGYFSVKDYGNTLGSPDTVQTDYDVNNFTSMGFLQGDINFANGWDLTAGGSLNFSSMQFTSLYPIPVAKYDRNFNNTLIPRIAVSKTFPAEFSVYVNLSSGFSPPTLSELLPSTNILNMTLQAEKGTDLDLGSRGQLFRGRLFYDVDFYLFNLKQSISERTDSSGADYYVNAGGTGQHGLEGYLNYRIFQDHSAFVSSLVIWTSQDWSDFKYESYQVLANNYSGNMLPGVAPYTMASGLDLSIRPGFSAHLTLSSQDRIPVNNANTAFANSYALLGARIGFSHPLSPKLKLEIFAGVDNVLNQKYSLGDDLNAAGSRYYNAAPGINYYGTVNLRENF